MPRQIVISDASPIITLVEIGELEVLKILYSKVYVTDIVEQELQMEIPEWIISTNDYDPQLYQSLCTRLDKGEASSIAVGMKLENPLLIIDERKGRKIAIELGLKITGLVGILLKAKEQGVISSGNTILEKLDKHGFRLSLRLKQLLIDK